MSVTMNRDDIARLIPHHGAMCLLDAARRWDGDSLDATASSHRDLHNPLRSASGLLAPCAIEYAAQAMALHGGLLAQSTGSDIRPGFLASVRGVRLHRLRLDDLPGELQVRVVRQAGDARQILYAFEVLHAGAPVVDGRATVVLNGDPHPSPLPQAGEGARPAIPPAGADPHASLPLPPTAEKAEAHALPLSRGQRQQPMRMHCLLSQ